MSITALLLLLLLGLDSSQSTINDTASISVSDHQQLLIGDIPNMMS